MSEIDRRILSARQTSRPDCPTIRALGDFLDQSIDAERRLPLLLQRRSLALIVRRIPGRSRCTFDHAPRASIALSSFAS